MRKTGNGAKVKTRYEFWASENSTKTRSLIMANSAELESKLVGKFYLSAKKTAYVLGCNRTACQSGSIRGHRTLQEFAPEQIDAAIRQLVSKFITTEGQEIDVFTAAELLEKLLKDEPKARAKNNLVQLKPIRLPTRLTRRSGKDCAGTS